MDIIRKKNWFFIFSLLVIIPGIISLLLFGLRVSIDFSGGSQMTFTLPEKVTNKTITKMKTVFTQEKEEVVTLQTSGSKIVIRTTPLDQKKHAKIVTAVKKTFENIKEEEFATIGPTVGKETTWNAIKGVMLASLLIVLYIAWSFRQVPKPASSWRFGICAIAALLHDALVVVGVFSILGHFAGVEVDSLFVTAILTIIGFSVHDTIVVFDRIRENLHKTNGVSFGTVVNDSILQTLTRSLNTSLTVILVLFTLLLFGGESTKWFIVALLIGVLSGTYSSIFNAAPLLVFWDEGTQGKSSKK